jgi:hypothetical protein
VHYVSLLISISSVLYFSVFSSYNYTVVCINIALFLDMEVVLGFQKANLLQHFLCIHISSRCIGCLSVVT